MLPTAEPLLAVAGLTVDYGPLRAVDGVDLDLAAGGRLGLIGESGSGKSQVLLAIIGLLAGGARAAGSVRLAGREILNAPEPLLDRLRGPALAMVFQDPLTSLNPYLTVGRQLTEALARHQGLGRHAARAAAAQMLERVRIPSPRARLSAYPHQLSGGMRQRVMLAMALLCRPALLLADEPTTALDTTSQAQVLDLLDELTGSLGAALLLVTHDLGIVAGSCDRVAVLYAGRVVETGPVAAIFAAPRHPYTRGLLDSVPRLDGPGKGLSAAIPGQPPAAGPPARGCAFAPRCPRRLPACAELRPMLLPAGADGTAVACHAPLR
jgi:oligopeptide transport system ATP-binding protein